MPFIFQKFDIPDLVLVKPTVFKDNRGFFMETYKKSEFVKNGIDVEFSQDNHSKSAAKVLRGLHFQKSPYQQAKIVRCTKGKIFDVAVDLRPHSATFKKYIKVELSEENKNMLYIPKGFAHGFVVLSEEAELCYKASGEYSPSHDRGILWSDAGIAINWEVDFEPILSKKDSELPCLKDLNGEDLL